MIIINYWLISNLRFYTYVFYYFPKINVMFYAIRYHLYNLKNVKTAHRVTFSSKV